MPRHRIPILIAAPFPSRSPRYAGLPGNGFVELALLYVPDMPPRVGIIVVILALVGAVKFTVWYPERARARPTA